MHLTIAPVAILFLLAATSCQFASAAPASSSPSPLALTSNDVNTTSILIPIVDDNNITTTTLIRRRKPKTHTLTLCQHAHRVHCFTSKNVKVGSCYALEPVWRNRVSSVYTEGSAGTVCKLFVDDKCKAAAPLVFGTMGLDDLKKVEGGRWNDKAGSVECET